MPYNKPNHDLSYRMWTSYNNYRDIQVRDRPFTHIPQPLHHPASLIKPSERMQRLVLGTANSSKRVALSQENPNPFLLRIDFYYYK